MARTREKEPTKSFDPVTEAVPPPHEARAPSTESDPQELTFLKPREGRVMSAELVEVECRELRKEVAQQDADRGAGAHRLGRRLHTLYTGYAERQRGKRTFTGFVEDEFGIRATRCRDLVRLAVATSEASARKYKFSRCILGLRLLELTGLESFAALERHPLDVGLGEPVHFPASVRHLQQAINVLKEQQRPKLSRAQQARLDRFTADLEGRRAKEPALARIRLAFVPGSDGHPVLEVGGQLDQDGRAALAKVLGQIVRTERSR